MEISIDTIYVGYDGFQYKAKATLTIEDDGTYYISTYDYWDPESNEWKATDERDYWTKDEIEEQFELKLD